MKIIKLILLFLAGQITFADALWSNNAGICQDKPAILTPEYLYEKALSNYPLVKQYGLIEQSRDYTLSNASKGYLPQLSFSAKATYQSEVTQIPLNMPGVTPLDKDQYQAVLELSQTIWDGGAVAAVKKATIAATEVEKIKNETELYSLKERVNQLYFGILLIEGQISQLKLLMDDLGNSYSKIKAYLDNGIVLSSDLDAIRVEQLRSEQKLDELKMNLLTWRRMLYVLTSEEMVLTEPIEKPETPQIPDINNIDRPELKLFDSQISLQTAQENTIRSLSQPKVGFFLQGGYGNPGLNMLKNEFSPFYIGGIRLQWNIGSLYTKKNSLDEIQNRKERVNLLKESFIFNTNMESIRKSNEIDKLRKQLESDAEIIRLRGNIKRAAEAKMENGTLQVSDLIREINAENLARQERVIHETEYLMAIYNLKYNLNR